MKEGETRIFCDARIGSGSGFLSWPRLLIAYNP